MRLVKDFMWDKIILGTDVYHIIQWFLIYSIIGWVVESIFMSICNRKLTNRGFIKGPICPIYGIGALTVYFVLSPFQGRYVMLYILGLILATTIEYVTARIMIFLFGQVWWDYNEKPFNYKGILCLESSVAWGFYTIFFFMFGHQAVMKFVDSYQVGVGKILAVILICYYLVDFTICVFKEKEDYVPERIIKIKDSINMRIKRS